MRPGPPNGAARARSRTGIAPALLLDVQTPAGTIFYWADRKLANIPAAITADGNPANVSYDAWLTSSASLNLYKAMQTDTATLSVQNLSGNVLERDLQKLMTRGTLEGSLYVLRYYAVDLAWAWMEQHGTLTMGEGDLSAELTLSQLLQGQDTTPEQTVTENCNIVWKEKRCGATGATECLYTYASCQVIEHFVGIQTTFETNNPESAANLPTVSVNRKRPW